MWRLFRGSPSVATRSQRMRPVRRSSAIDHPSVTRSVVGGVAVAVEPGLEGGGAAPADGGRDEHEIAPDHGAGMRQAGNGRVPEDGFAARRAPAVGQLLAIGHTRRQRPAEGRPAIRRRPPLRQWRAPRAGSQDNLAGGWRGCRARRQPGTAVQDHPSRGAVVGRQRESHSRGINRHVVTPGRLTSARTLRHGERHLAIRQRPRAGQRWPSLSGDGERVR